jgi:YbgC/YbaW family acyl-CoA thioester hydrolase
MKKIIETKIQKRFADIDVFRHVNNIHQQEYLDLGKTDYYEQVIGFDVLADRVALMIVSVKTDFAVQIHSSDEVFVRTRVERIGTKSITIRQQIVSRKPDSPDTVCTECESVLVAFDRRDQTTVEIPAAWRERIGE